MEKRTSHCKLSIVKALVEAGQVRATASAFQGARELGVENLAGMCAVVMSLTTRDFHKSHDQPRRPPHLAGRVPREDGQRPWGLLKLTVIDDVLIVSFKEL